MNANQLPVKARGQRRPIALTIAGSDSGGGAGVQADLHTFAALGVHGVSAITCLTAQNPRGVRAIQATTPSMVREQIAAIFEELPPAAAKTGMLYSATIIKTVAQFFRQKNCPPLIVDPVMVATSGARLLKPNAIRALQRELLPLAALVTPNVDEAELLADIRIVTVADLRRAARILHEQFGGGVLVKGGHLRGLKTAVDIFRNGAGEWLLETPRIQGVLTHGTGCTYAAAVTAAMARGQDLLAAVQTAKQFITTAIANSHKIARHQVLGWAAI